MPEREKLKPRLKIIGGDGNAVAILGAARRAAKAAGMPDEEWETVKREAMSRDYSHLLRVLMKYFDVC